MRRVLLVCLAGAACGMAPATARANGNYDGFQDGRQASFSTSAGGRRVASWRFQGYRYACAGQRSDARSYTPTRSGGFPLRADGTFAFTDRGTGTLTLGRRTAHGAFQLKMSGRLTEGSVRGTFIVSFRSRTLNCASGPYAFTAYRWGSLRAPFENTTTATGEYQARGSHSLRVSLRPLVPARIVRSIKVSDHVPCPHGYFDVPDLRVGTAALHGGTFRVAGRIRIGLTGGGVTTTDYGMSGRFRQIGGSYQLTGHLAQTTQARRGGRTIATCHLSTGFGGGLVRATTSGLRPAR